MVTREYIIIIIISPGGQPGGGKDKATRAAVPPFWRRPFCNFDVILTVLWFRSPKSRSKLKL